MLDTTHHVETPEGVDLELHAAGPLLRGLAYSVDLLLQFVILLVGGMLFGMLGGGHGLFLILLFLVNWFYPVVFEVLNDGKTPGKQAMKLQVVKSDGTPVDWGSSMLRNLLRVVDGLPFVSLEVPIPLFTFGLLSMLFCGQFRRIGDLAADTLVVRQGRRQETSVIPQGIEPKPPPRRLTLDEQRAMVGFAHRVASLSTDRAEELATVVKPLIDCAPEKVNDPVRYLIGIGAWIVGHRPGGQKIDHRTGR